MRFVIERREPALEFVHSRLEPLDPFGGGPPDGGGGPPQRTHLLGEVVRREEHRLSHHQFDRADAPIARLDRRDDVDVGLLLEQRERGPDVAGIGGSQRETFARGVHLSDVVRRKIGAVRGLPRRVLDLDAFVGVGEGDGNAIAHHGAGR